MKKLFKAAAIAVSAVVLIISTSCATTSSAGGSSKKSIKKIKYSDPEYKEAMIRGDHNTCLSMLAGIKNPDIAKQLDQGLLLHYEKDYEYSAESLEKTTLAIDDAFTKSISRQVGAAALSENISEYSGNIYEYLLVDTFNSLNYYHSGDLDSAYSRLVRTGDKQREYMAKYGNVVLLDDEADGDKLRKSMRSANLTETPYNSDDYPVKPTEANLYKTSPLADYLQIVIGAQNGSQVDEFIVRELKSIAPQVETDSANLNTKGRIEVLSLTGKIGQRYNKEVFIVSPIQVVDSFLIYYKYAWPAFDKLHSIVSNKTVKSVTLSDGTKKQPVLLEDFDKDCENDVIVTARRAAWRSIVRSTITKTTAIISAKAAYEAARNTNELAGALAWVGLQGGLIALDIKEVADTRQSIALPSKAYCTGFTVAPGVYSVKVEYSDGTTETIENIKVKPGKPVLVESICK